MKKGRTASPRLHKTIFSYIWKVVISGDVLEVYKYEFPVLRGYERRERSGGTNMRPKDPEKFSGVEPVPESLEEIDLKELSLRRTRRRIRNLVNANVYQYRNNGGKIIPPKFVTLTFREDVKDLKVAHKEFNQFIKRLNRRFGFADNHSLKYLAVTEWQHRRGD